MKKRLNLLIVFWGIWVGARAQEECGSMRLPDKKSVMEMQNRNKARIATADTCTTYNVPVYFTIFANDDSNLPAASPCDVVRQFENMMNQFKAHGISFVFTGYVRVNNSDLNDHNTSTEEAELDTFKVAGCLNVFVHNSLYSSTSSLNGMAYTIPNTYLSIRGSAISSKTNLATLSHEMGHCFGLFHPFETTFGRETVTRDSLNECHNCNTHGDLLCDTPADDPENPSSNFNSLCEYIGGRRDLCGDPYSPDNGNLMSYGTRACRQYFTTGQAKRMRTHLMSHRKLEGLIVENSRFSPETSHTRIHLAAGKHAIVARDSLNIAHFDEDHLEVSEMAEVHLQAKKIRLESGTHLYPAGGSIRVKVKSLPYCQ